MGGTVGAVFGEGRGHECGGGADAAHPLGAVAAECVCGAAVLADGVSDETGVAHGQGQALAEDRVVVPGGVTDEHHAVGVGLVGPGVVCGVGG